MDGLAHRVLIYIAEPSLSQLGFQLEEAAVLAFFEPPRVNHVKVHRMIT